MKIFTQFILTSLLISTIIHCSQDLNPCYINNSKQLLPADTREWLLNVEDWFKDQAIEESVFQENRIYNLIIYSISTCLITAWVSNQKEIGLIPSTCGTIICPLSAWGALQAILKKNPYAAHRNKVIQNIKKNFTQEQAQALLICTKDNEKQSCQSYHNWLRQELSLPALTPQEKKQILQKIQKDDAKNEFVKAYEKKCTELCSTRYKNQLNLSPEEPAQLLTLKLKEAPVAITNQTEQYYEGMAQAISTYYLNLKSIETNPHELDTLSLCEEFSKTLNTLQKEEQVERLKIRFNNN